MIGNSLMRARLGLAAIALSAALLTMPAWAADLTGPASGYTPGAIDKSLAGTTINLLVPPWGAYKQAKLDDFTARTGITVKVQTVDFESDPRQDRHGCSERPARRRYH